MTELLQINLEIILQRLAEKYTLDDVFAILDLSDEHVLTVFQDEILETTDQCDIL